MPSGVPRSSAYTSRVTRRSELHPDQTCFLQLLLVSRWLAPLSPGRWGQASRVHTGPALARSRGPGAGGHCPGHEGISQGTRGEN